MQEKIKTNTNVHPDFVQNNLKPKKNRGGGRQRKGEKPTRPCILLAITDRGKSGSLKDLFMRSGVFVSTVCMGEGTASSEIMDILGLLSSEKDVMFSIASQGSAREIMNALNDRLSNTINSKGIVCQINVSAASNLLVSAAQSSGKNSEDRMSEKSKYSLIIASVNRGYSDEVMTAAKSAGSRGGTVIRAHQIENDETVRLLGASFSAEREIVTILTAQEKRNDIMEEINTKCGVNTKANAVILSIPVDEVAKLS